jgi:hypothetical protein
MRSVLGVLYRGLITVIGLSLPVPASASPALGRLPFRFEPNRGQTAADVLFLARGQGYGLFVTARGTVLSMRGEAGERTRVVRMTWVDAPGARDSVGLEELPGRSHYLIGDPSSWRQDVPQFARVELRDVYPGVQVAYYGHEGAVEYDVVVSPGADPARIRLRVEGADSRRVDGDGNLVLETPNGALVHRAPVAYQEVDGKRCLVDARYVLRGRNQVAFALGGYDRKRPLVIDPVLVYSTYLGGSDIDTPTAVAVDATGAVYVAGYTLSPDFPTRSPAQGTIGSVSAAYPEAFVAKLDPSGTTLVYSTFLGGNLEDKAAGIAVDSAGSAYVVGTTFSPNFPMVNAFQPTYVNGSPSSRDPAPDAFVTKLSPSGSSLVYSTYLGGHLDDRAWAVAVDGLGAAYVTGQTDSSDFPTANPYRATLTGQPFFSRDVFVTKLTPSGSSLAYSTYLGGSDSEEGRSIAVDSAGRAFIAGNTGTSSPQKDIPFPTVHAIQAVNRGGHGRFRRDAERRRDDTPVEHTDGWGERRSRHRRCGGCRRKHIRRGHHGLDGLPYRPSRTTDVGRRRRWVRPEARWERLVAGILDVPRRAANRCGECCGRRSAGPSVRGGWDRFLHLSDGERVSGRASGRFRRLSNPFRGVRYVPGALDVSGRQQP